MMVWVSLCILAVGGMAMVVRDQGRLGRTVRSNRWAWPAVLVALSVVVIWLPGDAVPSGELFQDRFARASAALVLIVSAGTWPADPGKSGRRLLALCGAVMAASGNSLLTLWVGLLVMSSRDKLLWAADKRRAIGSFLLLLGVLLWYAAAGVLHVDSLSTWCSSVAGPLRIEVYVGLTFSVIGIALLCDLLGSADHREAGSHVVFSDALGHMLIGAVILLRLGMALPTLWWEWRWLLGGLAFVQAVITLDHWLRLYPEERPHLSWLVTLQGSMLLWALAWCQSPEGVDAGLALALNVALVSIGFWQARSGHARLVILTGLLLSLGGLPPSLGFLANVFLLRAGGWSMPEWQTWLYVATQVIPGALYAWGAVLQWRTDNGQPDSLRWIETTVGLLIAAGLMAMGFLARPFLGLTQWIMG